MASVSYSQSDSKVSLSNRYYEISVDLSAGTWSARNRITDMNFFEDAAFRVDHADTTTWAEPKTKYKCAHSVKKSIFGKKSVIKVTALPQEGYAPQRFITVALYPERKFIEIGWGVKNQFDRPVRVRNAEVLYSGKLLGGQKLENPKVLRSGSGADRNLVESGWEIEALNGALLTCKIRGRRSSMVAGGLKYSDYARRVELIKGKKVGHWGVKKGAGRNLNLIVWDPQGKLVAPKTTYTSNDTFYLDFVTEDPFEALELYGQALREANRADPNLYDFPTLCGWMVSTNHLGEGKAINNSPGLVEETRLARERGLMNYTPLAVRLEPDTYCHGDNGNTQQGWWDDKHWALYGPGGGDQKGNGLGSLRKPYETFAKFCRAVKELGGIPFTYFQSSMPSNDFAAKHPEWMLNSDISLLHVPHAHQMPYVRYDYTHPGFQSHCLNVWRRLRKAGLKGVKFDYPETAWARDGGFKDSSYTTTSAYREFYNLCRKGLGKDAFIHERILGGRAHEDVPCLDVTAGIADLQRVWGDASHFEPEMASRIGLRWYKSRSVFIYYPDGKSFMQDGRELPAYKRRAFLTMIAFLGGRIEIGTSIGSMTDDMFHDLTRMYPAIPGTVSPRPVDMFTGCKHPSVYVYEVDADWVQVLFINNNKNGKKVLSAPISGNQTEAGALGLKKEELYHACEFWNQEYIGKIKGGSSLSYELRGGEVAMISVRKVQKYPQVISTNRHIMQGMMECHNVSWTGKAKVLSGKVDVVAGEEFVLTVACNGRKPASAEGAEMVKRGRGLVDLKFVSQKNARKGFKLRF